MENDKILKAFYLISNELEKNLIKLERLDLKLKHAQSINDLNQAENLLKEYQKLNDEILDLQKKSEQLKNELEL